VVGDRQRGHPVLGEAVETRTPIEDNEAVGVVIRSHERQRCIDRASSG
jgi:hypothetical protein